MHRGTLPIAAVVVLLLLVGVGVDARRLSNPSKTKKIKPLSLIKPASLGGECAPHFLGAVTVQRQPGTNTASYQFHGPCLKAIPKDAVAWASFDDMMMKTGWGELTLHTSHTHADIEQAFAAGYLEGALTHTRIAQVAEFIKGHHGHRKVMDFFAHQDAFLRSKVTTIDPNDPKQHYWYNVALVIAQMDGMLAGYNEYTTAKKLHKLQMWLMNSDGDVLDLERALVPGKTVKMVSDMSQSELIELVEIFGHCSLLVKWTGDELYVGHTTWDDYAEMIRIYKHYNFGFNHPSVKSKKSSHSSYPGFVTSSDDFYLLDTGLLVTETTLNILNEKLYNLLDPKATVIAWVRNLVSNRMSTTGKEWCENFSKYNSGTYNDQWVIIDYKQFQPGLKQLKPNTLWVMEQIPGFTEMQDMSHVLTTETYWASYNRPYFPDIVHKSMYAHYTSKHGKAFSYKNCPRAKIFQRDHVKARDLESMKKLMMQNDWQHDPFSEGCPGNAIAARFDLAAPKCSMSRVATGATDAKVTNHAMAARLVSQAISGPTHDQQPPFSWDAPLFKRQAHKGLPTVWNFAWKEMSPKQI